MGAAVFDGEPCAAQRVDQLGHRTQNRLRLAGLISARRDGRRHIYTVDDPHVLTLVQQIFAHIAPDGSLAPDPQH